MIYARPTSDAQTLYIPRNMFMAQAGAFVLSVKNTVGLDRMGIKPDGVVLGPLYYEVTISFPDGMTEGEYEYELTQGGCLMASGLMIVGDYDEPRSEFAQSIQYKQYGR